MNDREYKNITEVFLLGLVESLNESKANDKQFRNTITTTVRNIRKMQQENKEEQIRKGLSIKIKPKE